MASKVSKNQKRRQKEKQKKQELASLVDRNETEVETAKTASVTGPKAISDDENDIVVETLDSEVDDSIREVMEKFNTKQIQREEQQEQQQSEKDSDSDQIPKDEVEEEPASLIKLEDISEQNQHQSKPNISLSKPGNEISKRKFKREHSIPLSLLKSISKFSSDINWQDVNSPDPFFHVYLRTLHNSVPVPRHWTSKKSFLDSKRGVQKPFELPNFIKATGIQDMRPVNDPADEGDNLKSRMRARVQPKAGQLDLDYHLLYDAFFKNQLKPNLLSYGDLYEGEATDESNLSAKAIDEMIPGRMSLELQRALGVSSSTMIPWLGNVVQLGPSPDYPNMKITNKGVTFGNVSHKQHSQWGKLVNDLDSDNEELDDDQNDDDSGDYSAQKGDVVIKTLGSAQNKPETANRPTNTNRPLYEILAQTVTGKSNGSSSIFGSQAQAYDMNSNQPNKRKRTEEEAPKRAEQGSAKKFRF